MDLTDKDTLKKLFTGGLVGAAAVSLPKILRGMAFGIIMILLAFVLIWVSLNSIAENSVTVADMEVQEFDALDADRQMIKAYGYLTVDNPLDFSVGDVSESNLIYYSIELQRFEVIRNVREDSETGEQRISYSQDWVTKSETEFWAGISISDVEVDFAEARDIIEKQSMEVEDVEILDIDKLETYNQGLDEGNPEFGSTRALVSLIPNDGREYLVVGQIRGDSINSGDPFIVTDMTDADLIAFLGQQESNQRLGARVVAFILLTLGFTSMLSPILVLTDYVPLVGSAARGVATFISAILALIVVMVTLFLLKFWWLILLVIVVGLLGFAYLTISKKDIKTN